MVLMVYVIVSPHSLPSFKVCDRKFLTLHSLCPSYCETFMRIINVHVSNSLKPYLGLVLNLCSCFLDCI